jgi:O-antigen/teichoic acid export membrane protein
MNHSTVFHLDFKTAILLPSALPAVLSVLKPAIKSKTNQVFNLCLSPVSAPNPTPLKKYFSSYWIRSAFYTFLQRFSLTFFGLVNFMVLIRTLLPEQMGTWALFLIVTTIFEASKTNLLKNAQIKYVSAAGEGESKSAIASSSLLINALISLLFILIILGFSNGISQFLNAGRDLALMLQWFIPGLVMMIYFSHFEAIQQSHLDFKGGFAGYFVRQVSFFTVIIIHFVFDLPLTLTHLALYQSGSILLGTILLYVHTRKYLLFRFDPTKAWIKKLLGYGSYIFGSGLVANIYSNLDQVMTATMLKSTASVAHYNAASRINQLIDIPSYAAAEILFPKMSKAAAEEGDSKVKYLYERMVAVLLSFTIPAAVFIMIFPQLIITIIAGSQYRDAALILQIYMLTGILRPMQNQAANLLNSVGKQKLCFVINTVSLAANLGINYLCLKEFGFYGAAIGTLITCVIGTTVWYIIMKRQIHFSMGNIVKFIGDTYKTIYVHAAGILFKTKQVHA